MAETNATATEVTESNVTEETIGNTPSIEDLMTELANEKAARAKDKVALDKALKEKGDLTKQLRERMSAKEIEDEAKREEQEQQRAELDELLAYKQKNEALKRYMNVQGMPADLAEQAAEAEVSGDMDALSKIQKQFIDASIKEKESEWLRSRPDVRSGNYSQMSKEEIFAIKDRDERRRAISENLGIF